MRLAAARGAGPAGAGTPSGGGRGRGKPPPRRCRASPAWPSHALRGANAEQLEPVSDHATDAGAQREPSEHQPPIVLDDPMALVVRMEDPGELLEKIRDPVRLERARRRFRDVRVLQEPLDDRELLALAERREVDVAERRHDDSLLGGLLVDGLDARAGVLDVVDGILRRLAGGPGPGGIQPAVVAPPEGREARGGAADLFHPL